MDHLFFLFFLACYKVGDLLSTFICSLTSDSYFLTATITGSDFLAGSYFFTAFCGTTGAGFYSTAWETYWAEVGLLFFFFLLFLSSCWLSFLAATGWGWGAGSCFLTFLSGLKSGYYLMYSSSLVVTWMVFFLISLTSYYKTLHLPSSFSLLLSLLLISGLISHSSYSLETSSFLFSSTRVSF